MFASLRPPRLYAITDTTLSGLATHVEIVDQLLRGGCTWIQLREKSMPDDLLYSQILQAIKACHAAGARLIVNDRVDLAWAAGADGVHLGQEDLPPAEARKVLAPGSLIGQSTHTLEQALASEADPAVDYVAIGPLFQTATKDSPHQPLGLEGLRRVRQAVRKPLVAIGGIDAGNILDVLRTGCDSAAVISGLMATPSIAETARSLQSLLARV